MFHEKKIAQVLVIIIARLINEYWCKIFFFDWWIYVQSFEIWGTNCITYLSKLKNYCKLFSAHLSFGNVLKGILNQGDCSVNTMEKLMSFEWKNQILDKKRYLYTFAYDIGISEIVSSMQLKSDPYRPIFREKMSHMEENGLMGRMFLQLKPMKPMESEKLKALELEHFYFVFIGISVGLAASLLATICEICHAKCQEKITKWNTWIKDIIF